MLLRHTHSPDSKIHRDEIEKAMMLTKVAEKPHPPVLNPAVSKDMTT